MESRRGSSALDEIRLPFTMKATVTYGDPPQLEPWPDPLPPGWIRIPVSFQITLPAEVVERARRGGAPAASGHAPPESFSLVPHSLRIGTGPHKEDGRTWQDFGALFDALDDDPSVPDATRISQDELTAALRHEPYPIVPLLAPWRAAGAPPIPQDFDTFLDFLNDPERHPLPAPPGVASRTPGPGKSAPPSSTPGHDGDSGSMTIGASSAVARKADALAEVGFGATMTAVGAGETAFGVATVPEGVGIPIVVEGVATASVGIGLYEDGLGRLSQGVKAAMTPHVDPRPPSPPLVPPVVPPPIEGFSTDPKAGRPHSLITTPVQPGPMNEGLVVGLPQGPTVVTLYGDGTPDTIWWEDQDRHTIGKATYDQTRSPVYYPDPQALLDAHSGHGQPKNSIPRGQPGFGEFFDTGGEIVGLHRDKNTGIESLTTRGQIHHSKHGAHIVPAPP